MFALGLKTFVKDSVLERKGFFSIPADEPPSANIAAFSISEVVLRYLKLNFGRRFLMVDLLFDVEGSGESFILIKLGLGLGEKITLLGVRVGVAGI